MADKFQADDVTQAEFGREEILFERALTFSTDEARAIFLDQECTGQPKLRSRLDLMLEAHFKATAFLSDVSLNPEQAAIANVSDGKDYQIGRYIIRRTLGEGGYGTVYLAEQLEPIHRLVALKVIKLGMDTRNVIARFQAERQTLAILDHPNIAKVIDAGATESGRPYFVMELVEGLRVTDYCRQMALDTRARIALFIEICQAVQHAHQKGIIHRDLKPSNILVTNSDGKGVPKVIDFGVAKATEHAQTDFTILTQFPQLIGTPAYMSPEQVDLSSDLDTRTDIYSLGALLYEILTGTPPFSTAELQKNGFAEMRRLIQEEEPVRPSIYLGGRSRDAGERFPLDRDLDWIVMKCLEKDRSHRYESASALAADLQRCLNDEPIAARPPSTAYTLRKAIRRNRTVFIAGCAAATALVVGLFLTTIQAVRARKAEQEQREQTRIAQNRLRVTLGFIDELLQNVQPEFSQLIGASQANDALLRSIHKIMAELQVKDTDDEQFRFALAQLYYLRGLAHGWYHGNTTADYERARDSALEGIRLLTLAPGRAVQGESQLLTLVNLHMVAGYARRELLEFEQSINHFQEMGKFAAQLKESKDPQMAYQGAVRVRWAYGSQGVILLDMGRLEEGLEICRQEAQDLINRQVREDSPDPWDLHDLTTIAAALGDAQRRLEKNADSVASYREAIRYHCLQVDRKPNDGAVAGRNVEIQARFGEALAACGHLEEAQKYLAQSLELSANLIRRDPNNGGHKRMRIEALRCNALGYKQIALQTRNEQSAIQAEEYLREAEAILQSLPEPSTKLLRIQFAKAQQALRSTSPKK